MENLGRIGFSEEQAALLEVAESFCRDRSPMGKVRALLEDEKGFDEAVWQEIVDLGWLGIAISEEFGGAGLSLAEAAPVMEAMGRRMLTTPFASTLLVAEALMAGGGQAQKEYWLPRIAEGMIGALALNEPDGRWDDEALQANAALSGDGYALTGVKTLVADAGVADLIIASVSLNGAPALVLIEKGDLPDGALRRETIIDETKRSYALTLDGATVGAAALLDPEKAAAALARIRLAADLLSSAEMVGGAFAVIEYTIDYLNTRKQFGKPIGAYQALKHPTVDAFVGAEQARSHLYAAAHCMNEQGAGEIAVAMAKASAEKALAFASDRSIQFHGGFGFTYDCDAHFYRRRALFHAAQFGDAGHQKKKLAAMLLG